MASVRPRDSYQKRPLDDLVDSFLHGVVPCDTIGAVVTHRIEAADWRGDLRSPNGSHQSPPIVVNSFPLRIENQASSSYW